METSSQFTHQLFHIGWVPAHMPPIMQCTQGCHVCVLQLESKHLRMQRQSQKKAEMLHDRALNDHSDENPCLEGSL